LAKRSVVRTSSWAKVGVFAAWPAFSTTTSSAPGQALRSSHAFPRGAAEVETAVDEDAGDIGEELGVAEEDAIFEEKAVVHVVRDDAGEGGGELGVFKARGEIR